jgi:cytochrome c2
MQTLKLQPASTAQADTGIRTASQGATVQPASAGQGPQGQGADYATGEKLFTAKGCVACHALYAVNAPKGMVGPNLANVGARSYIAAGTLKNTDENLSHWIRDPQGVKKGVLMPNLGVTPAEAQALVAFLRAHK